MGNETYDEYIRSILGYPPVNIYNNANLNSANTYTQVSVNMELEQYYPEIYKIIYPMITKKCNNVSNNLTNEDIENMTDEIYSAVEENNQIQVNINLGNDIKSSQTNIVKTTSNKAEVKVSETAKENRNTRQINGGLRDLIKILLIRELINRPGRPQMPRPPMPGPRPPIRPPYRPGIGGGFNREFETSNYDIFEY